MKIRDEPRMVKRELEIMDSLFRVQRPKRVLDWSEGGATVYWPQRYAFIKKWVAVRRGVAFAEALKKRVASKVLVKCRPASKYWELPKSYGQFGMIIVDGADRMQCLEAALGLLATGGIVVLHDSGRPSYNEAWKLWPFAETLYAGEKPTGGGYYKHRGISVFWRDEEVKTGGWNRKHVGAASLPKRPKYVPLCTDCDYMGSDAGHGDEYWFVCNHPRFEFPGKILPPSLVRPSWCPLLAEVDVGDGKPVETEAETRTVAVRPWCGEDYEVHLGGTDFQDKVILDIGADWGSTADFFLRKGAKQVIAVERDAAMFDQLRRLSLERPAIVAIKKGLTTQADFAAFVEEYGVDLMKVDCEGCEAYLLDLDDEVFSRVPEYLIEVHPKAAAENYGNVHPYGGIDDLRRRFAEKLKRCGFQVLREWKFLTVWMIHARRR